MEDVKGQAARVKTTCGLKSKRLLTVLWSEFKRRLLHASYEQST
jgi:hypothetical protein